MDGMAAALGRTNFGALDWGIVVLYLLVSVVVGLVSTRYVKDMADYVSAGRGIGTWLGIATLTGSELGLITIMYSSQKGFSGGFAAFHIAVAAAVVTFAVGVTGFFVYRLRELEVLTIPEFYEKRFGRRTRVLGGVMLALGGILNMGLFLKVGSMFIVGVTGLSAQGWALPAVMVSLLSLVLVYTVLGGMVSVVVTDYVQFVVLSFGLLAVTCAAVWNLGWDHIFGTVAAQMGEPGFNPLLAESAFGVEYMVWMAFLGLVSCAIWPTAVARALAAESPESVRKQYMLGSIGFLIRFLIPYFLGISAFVYIKTKAPDLDALFFPADGGAPVDNLYAMPIFLARIIPTGLIGLISAAMIAAFMSTHDSYLLCWASVITQDVIAPLRGERMDTASRIKWTRIFIVLIGLYILYWGLVYKGTDDIWDYMSVTGAIYFSGTWALLLGGLYWKRASSTGAVAALLCGLFAVFGLGPVKEAVGLTMSGARVGLLTVALTTAAMFFGSLAFPDRALSRGSAASKLRSGAADKDASREAGT